MAISELKKGLGYQHIAICQFMVTNPEFKVYEIAKEFGVSPQWISDLTGTDGFKMQLATLQAEMFQEGMKARTTLIQERVFNVLDRGLDVLEGHLEYNPEEDSPPEHKEVNRTVEILLSATPLKRNNTAPPPRDPSILVFPVPNSVLQDASRDLGSPGVTYEADPPGASPLPCLPVSGAGVLGKEEESADPGDEERASIRGSRADGAKGAIRE